MSDVALLMAIRHQLRDTWDRLKIDSPCKVIEGDEFKARRWDFQGEFVNVEYPPNSGFISHEPAPLRAVYWPALKPLEALIHRVDSYIKAGEAK